MELWREVGRLVKGARVAAGFKTQTELARTLPNVKQNTLSAIETGSMHPTLATLAEIAQGIGVPLNALVPGPRDAADLRTLLKDPGRNVTYRGVTLSESQREAIMTMLDAAVALGTVDRVGLRDTVEAVEPTQTAPAPKREPTPRRRIAKSTPEPGAAPIDRIAALHTDERNLAKEPTTADERAEQERVLRRHERAELERRRRKNDAGAGAGDDNGTADK